MKKFLFIIGIFFGIHLFIPQFSVSEESVDVPYSSVIHEVVSERFGLGVFHDVPKGFLPISEDRKPRIVFYLSVTAYSSSFDETDGDPWTTASGSTVRDGMLAYNFLPFGTHVRFPDAFPEKTFVVEDRLNPRSGRYLADIWMPTKQAAKQWGVKVLKIEVL